MVLTGISWINGSENILAVISLIKVTPCGKIGSKRPSAKSHGVLGGGNPRFLYTFKKKLSSVWSEILKKILMHLIWRYSISSCNWFHKGYSATTSDLWGNEGNTHLSRNTEDSHAQDLTIFGIMVWLIPQRKFSHIFVLIFTKTGKISIFEKNIHVLI